VNLRQSVTFLIWFGFKQRAGEPFTDQELKMFEQAHDVTVSKAPMLFIKPEDYAYTPGKPFDE